MLGRKLVGVAMALLAPSLFAQEAAAPGPLTWRLENPFRLFRDAKDFEKLKMLPNEDVSTWFRRHAHLISGDYLPARRTWWDPEGGVNRTGQYEPGYLNPASHRVVLRWEGQPAAAMCDWEVGGRELRAACSEVRLTVPFNADAAGRGEALTVKVTDERNRKAGTTMRIRDVLVLGLGDSYSAGEGAPDRPASLTRLDSNVSRLAGFDQNSWAWVPEVVSGKAALWWDNECHRSLLSWQVLAALKIASDDANSSGARSEQMSVTFASYACSGAGISDGLLLQQEGPPGPSKEPRQDGRRLVQRSQLHAASRDMCDGRGLEIYRRGSGGLMQYHMQCPSPRRPDLVLFSIGGNDAGFAKVIMHTLLPQPTEGNSVLGSMTLGIVHGLKTVSPRAANARIYEMVEQFPALREAMSEAVLVEPSRVVFMQYPNPLMRPQRLRVEGDSRNTNRCGLEMRAGMEATRFLMTQLKAHWHMWGTQEEHDHVVSGVVIPLHEQIAKHKGEWKLVARHLDDFEEHGLCADAVEVEPDTARQPEDAKHGNVAIYAMPRQPLVPGTDRVWYPPPYYFDGAYNPHQKRWIRTPNDSVQVQTQPRIDESLSGSFHPNGGGYARMADAAVEEIRQLLNAPRR